MECCAGKTWVRNTNRKSNRLENAISVVAWRSGEPNHLLVARLLCLERDGSTKNPHNWIVPEHRQDCGAKGAPKRVPAFQMDELVGEYRIELTVVEICLESSRNHQQR